ncbi:MAG TPA: hypothetical protein VKS60_13870 [Stellaceae bacterium]|nr:hypothetical protein [Stellaceae bacterium]
MAAAWIDVSVIEGVFVAAAKAGVLGAYALARSAAPAALSGDTTILVLTRAGYQTAAEGKNGFTCLVERGWMAPFDGPDFKNPALRAPVCCNAAAVRSHLPYVFNRPRLALAGADKDRMRAEIKDQVAAHALPLPEPGTMSYMMSKDQNLGQPAHWRPHVMFYLPRTEAARWGANLPGSPVRFDPTQDREPELETTFFVIVDYWSEGTMPEHEHG